MTFTNPAILNVTTQTVTLPAVLYADYWAWLPVVGEPYPPTLTGATYSQLSGRTAYACTASAQAVTFPILPRIGPNQSAAGKLTISCQVNLNSGVSCNLAPFQTSDSAITVLFNSGSGLYQVTYRKTNGATANIAFTAAPSSGAWHRVDFVYDEAGGTFDFLIDGATVIAGPVAHQSTATQTPQLKLLANNASGVFLAAVRATWA